jgi:hypothetical protein
MEVTVGAAATALPPRPALAPSEPDRVGDLPRWPLEMNHSPAFRVVSITWPIMPPASGPREARSRKTPQVPFTGR